MAFFERLSKTVALTMLTKNLFAMIAFSDKNEKMYVIIRNGVYKVLGH